MLKTEFNPVWNYFNAKELGDTIFNYWSEYMERAMTGNYTTRDLSRVFPEPEDWRIDPDAAILPEFTSEVRLSRGHVVEILDLKKLIGHKPRMVVSRRKTANFFNLTSLWKKSIFGEFDKRVLEDMDIDREISPMQTFESKVPPQAVVQLPSEPLVGTSTNPVSDYRTEHLENIHRRSKSPDKPMFG